MITLTQSEEVTHARLAESLAALIARRAGSGESIYQAVNRALEERPDIVRAVHEAEAREVVGPSNPAALRPLRYPYAMQ